MIAQYEGTVGGRKRTNDWAARGDGWGQSEGPTIGQHKGTVGGRGGGFLAFNDAERAGHLIGEGGESKRISEGTS